MLPTKYNLQFPPLRSSARPNIAINILDPPHSFFFNL